MDLYETINDRYSVREFDDRPIDPAALRRVLDAGRISPSGRNRQDRKFIVVTNAELRQDLSKAAEQAWLAKAPVIIAVICTDPRDMSCGIPAGPVDCAIAIDHMTLAAVAEGLGSCWIGHFDQGECKHLLCVPKTMDIIEMLAIGYPAGPAKTDKPRKDFNEVVCFERYS